VSGLRQRFFAWLMAIVARRYDAQLGDRKAALLGALRGTVLEIGPGTGASLRFFDTSVRWIGLEPSPAMQAALVREADRLGRAVDLRDGRAEATGLADGSVDAVVSSLVLCSVRDLSATLAELHRVLRPGGTLVVIEHVAAPPGTVQRVVQRVLSRPWQAMFDGCNPERDTAAAIADAGFVELALDRIAGPLPPPVRPHIVGTARRPV